MFHQGAKNCVYGKQETSFCIKVYSRGASGACRQMSVLQQACILEWVCGLHKYPLPQNEQAICYHMYIYKRLSTDVGNGLVQKVTQPCNDWKNHPVLMIQPNLPEHMCAP